MIFPTHGRRKQRAFTLVDVCLAIGLVSFSLLCVVGLLPIGITTMRKAMDSTIERNIVQQLTAEAMQTPFGRLADVYASGSTRFFDDQGLILSSPANARYTTVVAPGQTEFPGSTNADLGNAMQMLQIRVSTPAAATTNYYNILMAYSAND